MSRLTCMKVVLAASCFVMATAASAQVPHLIRYQGQAVDSQGVPLEGPYTLTFRLYDAATGGAKLWEEAQANVPLAGGQFSVLLGEVTSLDAMDWSQPCWLSVQINTDPELAPRQRITSVPLAVRAESAERLTQAIPPALETGTWMNVTGSRAISTIYQNTTGKKMRVAISVTTGNGGNRCSLFASPTMSLVEHRLSETGTTDVTGASQFGGLYGEVPASWYYGVGVGLGSGCTVDQWEELIE